MTNDPEVHDHELEPRSERGQARGLWLSVFVVATIALLSIATTLVISVRSYTNGENHHAQQVQANRTMGKLLHDIAAAQKDHATTLNEVHAIAVQVKALDQEIAVDLPAAKTALVDGQSQLQSELRALCSSTHADCPSLTG